MDLGWIGVASLGLVGVALIRVGRRMVSAFLLAERSICQQGCPKNLAWLDCVQHAHEPT